MAAGTMSARAGLGLCLALGAALGPATARAELLRPDATHSLAEVVRAARDGDVVEVPPGRWSGPLRIESRITLRGAGGTIDGGGHGTVITVVAPDVTLDGLDVSGSGVDLGAPDSGIWTAPTAVGVTVLRSHVHGCAFGIYVQESDHARVEENVVEPRSDLFIADRGNGIHFFDAEHVTIARNHVSGGRDGLFIAATDDSLIEDNVIEHTRYAIHYMWSHRNVLRGNIVRENLSGFALMQSHHLLVEGNLVVHNTRAGMLLRDGENCMVRQNRILANGQGLFVYNSQHETLEANLLLHNDIGAKLWGSLITGGVFTRNAFVGNGRQIVYVGGHDMVWGEDAPGNHFSDYLGWDQDRDGAGDRPYRVDGFSSMLVERFPAAVLLLRSPALELLSHLEERMPVLRTPTVVDRAPRVRDETDVDHALPDTEASLSRITPRDGGARYQ